MISDEDLAELRSRIGEQFEWLTVFPEGRTHSIVRDEIEIDHRNGKAFVTLIGERGLGRWRIGGVGFEKDEIVFQLIGQFGKTPGSVRLVPRISASELSRDVELARLLRANEIAQLLAASFYKIKIERIALNEPGGRQARILFDIDGAPSGLIADVTNVSNAESLLSAALLWFREHNERRKRRIEAVWIAAEKRTSRQLARLHALLKPNSASKIIIAELTKGTSHEKVEIRERLALSSLWRERPPAIKVSERSLLPNAAEELVALAPDAIDTASERNGTVLRYNGLPFARIRTTLGIEKVWFGTGRASKQLLLGGSKKVVNLVEEIARVRRAESDNPRHEYFKTSPEAWLESILRRDITQLDANLIISPIYDQFRTSAGKIDLLALRRDGRLVVIEVKTSPDRSTVFQAAGYWRKIELQRRRGELAKANLFADREISDEPALVYVVAPALSFHREFEHFAQMLVPEIELWRFELHENWRRKIKVIARKDYSGRMNR